MVRTETIVGVIAGLMVEAIVAFLALTRTRLTLNEKRRRIAFLKEIEEPEFYQIRQRELWMYIGVALYALGCYVILSDGFPRPAIMIWKVATGLTLLWCGIKVMSNAAVMNAYGVNIRKDQIEELRRKAREEKELLDQP